jgi:hypothetical protein
MYIIRVKGTENVYRMPVYGARNTWRRRKHGVDKRPVPDGPATVRELRRG